MAGCGRSSRLRGSVSPLAQPRPNAINRTMPGCGAVRAMGFRSRLTGVPRGTRATGLGARRRGLGDNATRTCELVPLVARPEYPELEVAALGPTCRCSTTLDKRLKHPAIRS